MGVIGIYVSVVLVAGRFLRMAVTDMHFRIMYDDINNCDILLALVNDVKMCREVCAQLWYGVASGKVSVDGLLRSLAAQIGNHYLEEVLYRHLVEVYRDPGLLKLWTNTRLVVKKWQ